MADEAPTNGNGNGNGFDVDYMSRVEMAITQLETSGQPVTHRALYAMVRGQHDRLTRYLRWRATQTVSVAVDVPEAPEHEPGPPRIPEGETPAEWLARLEEEQAAEQAELAQLQHQRSTARLSRDSYITLLMLADSVELRERELDAARQQVWQTMAAEAMHHAQEVHDLAVEQVVHLCEAVVTAIADLQASCAELASAIDSQSAPLLELRDARGQPAFDLIDGRSQTQRLLSTLPGGWNLIEFLYNASAHDVTRGELKLAVDALPSTRPLSPVAVANYLKGFEQ